MGTLVLDAAYMTLNYESDYRETGLPGLSLLDDIAAEGQGYYRYPVTEQMPLLPRLRALVPGNNPRNLQRAHYLDVLRRRGTRLPPGIETEWALLLMGGHGGVGHVDVFRDDREAMAWYAAPNTPQGHTGQTLGHSGLWQFLRSQVLDEVDGPDVPVWDDVLGPTPSVGGMIPKLLVAMAPEGAGGALYPPGTPGKTDVLLKVEPPEYPGLLALESLCLEVHRTAGIEVPNWWTFENDGLRFLAITRFDRPKIVPVESLFSVIATGNHEVQSMGDVMLEDLGGILRILMQTVDLAPDTPQALYQRFLMAYLTGNGDLHMENLSLVGSMNGCRLAPVYDPAPMRAWPRHDLVSAIPFDGAEYASQADVFVKLGHNLGLSNTQVHRAIERALDAVQTYPERVSDCLGVPAKQRQRLVMLSQNAANKLRQAIQ